ncbi:MAG: hypothetical protein QM715_05735 [Nibricoccus sp.]
MSSHGKIRLACRIIRIRDAMTGSRAGHVAHCADCQAYYRTAESLSDQLRATAPRPSQPVPDELAARIARAVRQSTPTARAPRRTRAFETFAILGAAAAVFAFAFYLVRQNVIAPRAHKTESIASTNAADFTALVAGVDSLRSRLLDSVEPAAETLAEQNPLSREIASVQADARSALGFLALNFLPADSAQQLEARIDPSRS